MEKNGDGYFFSTVNRGKQENCEKIEPSPISLFLTMITPQSWFLFLASSGIGGPKRK
jgi:hypothetical protein